MTQVIDYSVALGGNLPSALGGPAETLRAAASILHSYQDITITALSRFHRTSAFPPGSGPDFVNAALTLQSALVPEVLLARLHEVEAELGRRREGGGRWQARPVDLDLIAGLAAARPDWSVVMIGPVVKIDPASLPQAPNLHWLGQKSYDQLPAYLAGWDVALMPFAMNEATRYISPTKTPEYLAAGCPVVSTPVRDVVRHYGDLAAVRMEDPEVFAVMHTAVRPLVADGVVELKRRATGEKVSVPLAKAIERLTA